MEIKNIKINKLKVNTGQINDVPKNPRLIKDARFEALKKSIQDFPEMLQYREVVVYDNNGEYVIVGGNMRYRACKELGYTELPCKIFPKETEAKRLREFVIKDNRAFGTDDIDILANEWDEMELIDFGFEEFELGLDVVGEEAEEDDFEPRDEDKIKTDIVKGDLFDIYKGGKLLHKVLCGDATSADDIKKLMGDEKADMVLTDPPFPNNSKIMHEMIIDIEDAFLNFRIFCDNLILSFWDNLSYPPIQEMLTAKHIWQKTNGWQANHYETMYCYHNDNTRHEQLVFSFSNVAGDNIREKIGNYQTPKPVKLIIEIIDNLKLKNNLILDAFLGSGSTLIASHQLNRRCYGMELSERYCQAILERIYKLDKDIIIMRGGNDETEKFREIK